MSRTGISRCAIVVLLGARAASSAGAAGGADPHSWAEPEVWRTSHLELDLSVDFAERRLVGHVDLRLEPGERAAGRLVLDTRELEIRGVTAGADEAGLEPVAFELGAGDPVLGRPLLITLPAETVERRRAVTVRIRYRTAPQASGLQWLEPAQTAGGRRPFLFSQSQTIHARSWVPLQDTPAVRMTYAATIRTPPGLLAVMSAENDPAAAPDGVHRLRMPQPIPSYLLALAVGELRFEPLGPRTGVYAEPSVLEAAAWEFADTERMLEIGESLYGPYRWGRYDLLILPPSFPFGGMENPRLSFITPTVIAGDRSLVALIAHELAHSWSGNLVTNASWNDLWLNEGFTVFFESRIMEAIYGERRARMEAVLGLQSLREDFAELPDEDEHLVLDLAGRDPDDGFSDVPYEKGRLLLDALQARVGRQAFDAYLRDYFDRHAFQSMSTPRFVADLEARFGDAIDRAELDAWLHAPGLPAGAVLPSSDAFERVAAQRDGWLTGRRPVDALQTGEWTVHEWLYFLETLPPDLAQAQLVALDRQFELTAAPNNEIAHAWLKIAIAQGYAPAWPRLERYLSGIGRNKLIEPLYKELLRTPAGALFAGRVYRQARPGYHPLTRAAIEKLGIAPGTELGEAAAGRD